MNDAQFFLAATLFCNKYFGIPLKTVENVPKNIAINIIKNAIMLFLVVVSLPLDLETKCCFGILLVVSLFTSFIPHLQKLNLVTAPLKNF